MADGKDKRNYSQWIEANADTYRPSIYQVLTFYHNMQTQTDQFDGQFIPISGVPDRLPRDVKIFAVGLLPPSNEITERLLDIDRFATEDALNSSTKLVLDPGPTVTNDSVGTGVSSSTPVPVGPTQAKDERDFWQQYVAMCNRLGVQAEEMAKVIYSESRFLPGAGKPIYNSEGKMISDPKGLIQLIRPTAIGKKNPKTGKYEGGLGMTPEMFDNFKNLSASEQLPWVEKFFAPNGRSRVRGKDAAEVKAVAFGNGNGNPDGSLYNQNAESLGYTGGKKQATAYAANYTLDRDQDGKITPKELAYVVLRDGKTKDFKDKVLTQIQKAKAALDMGTPEPEPVKEEPAKEAWVGTGENNAQESAKTLSMFSDTMQNRAAMGARFEDARRQTVFQIGAALQAIAETPPLRMLVNPSSFRVSSDKVINESAWGRNGPIEHHWGDNQDKIEGSGKIAATYSMDAVTGEGPGLTRNARQYSKSYQNLLSLWLIYRNNAGVYLPDPIGSKGGHNANLALIGSVYLYYDDIMYIGSFDSFSITESDTAPYTVEYSFSFTVRAWYLLDHLNDSSYTYGEAPVKQTVPTTNFVPLPEVTITAGATDVVELPEVTITAGAPDVVELPEINITAGASAVVDLPELVITANK